MEFPIKGLKGRPPIYLNSTHFAITEQQAKSLCNNSLPKLGYEKCMNMQDLNDNKKTTNEYKRYYITRTQVSCRTDLETGTHWCIYFS